MVYRIFKIRISCFNLGSGYFIWTENGYFQNRLGEAGEEEFLGEGKVN